MEENKLVQLFRDMLKDELKPIKDDIKDIKQDIKSLQSQVQENTIQIKSLQSQVQENTIQIKSLQSQVQENTGLIKALVHSSEVHKAEQDNIQNDIAHLQGDITYIKSTTEEIRKDLNNVEIITSSNWNDIAKLKAVK